MENGVNRIYNVRTMNKKIMVLIILCMLAFAMVACTWPTSNRPVENPLSGVLESTVSTINTQTAMALPTQSKGTNNIPKSGPGEGTGAPTVYQAGPERYSPGVNPLTGQVVADPELLKLPPALVSISNFPPSARKLQGGLSTAAQVFEIYIGEGMTRFLAVFYGNYPDPNALPPDQNMTVERPTGIGPIRSGRTVYESIRSRLNGFLVMASADRNVRSQLSGATNIFGSDADDINSAMIDVSQLMQLAEDSQKPIANEMLSGNSFSNDLQPDGLKGEKLWVFYNALDQVLWEYHPEMGGYYRYQDNADESGNFTLTMDAFTGQPLLFENVIVLFAEHEFLKPTLINIDLDYVNQGKALLFRDGMMYKIYWTTRSTAYEQNTGLLRPIRFTNYYGEAFFLKPGQSWVHLVDINHRYWEADPERPFETLDGSGFWSVRFYDPTQN